MHQLHHGHDESHHLHHHHLHHHGHHGHHQKIANTEASNFSSNDSNICLEEEGRLSPMIRPRSRSLSSPIRSPGSDTDIIMMNSVYKERFPKATQQMEEKLTAFIRDQLEVDHEAASDAVFRFAHHQVIEIAKDCLQKSQDKLITSKYFFEMTENLEKLLNECYEKSNVAANHLRIVVKKLLVIICRPARLLECLEFDPEEFYRMLEAEEGQAKVIQGVKTSVPQYIITKLGLNRDPLADLTTELVEDSAQSDVVENENCDNQLEEATKPPSEEDFDVIKLISNGAYGAVYLVRYKETKQRFAMKKINKQNLILRNQVEQVFAERDIMSFTDNPFVVSMFCSFETKKYLCLVMEYVEGGDCATLLKNMGPLPVDLARLYFAETVLAVEYLHNYGIVHRDLKPDNLLITSMGHIKLTDFGLSKMGLMNLATNLYEGYLDRETKQFTDKQVFGTPEYLAPEVILRQGYGRTVDWWSLGIILYEFLIGCVPFFGETPEELFAHVINDEIEWPDEEDWPMLEESKDIITQLLQHNPIERLGAGGATEVKNHSFFNNINWESLLRQKAEFIPQLEGEEDTSYFDTRTDRHNHEFVDSEELEDTDDSSMFGSFSSCSPRYRKVYSRVEKELEQEFRLRQSSSSSSLRDETLKVQYSRTDSTKSDTAIVGSPNSIETPKLKVENSSEIIKRIAQSTSESSQTESDDVSPQLPRRRKPLNIAKDSLPKFSFSIDVDERPSASTPSHLIREMQQSEESQLNVNVNIKVNVNLNKNTRRSSDVTSRLSTSARIQIPTNTSPNKHKNRTVTKSASTSGLSLIISDDPNKSLNAFPSNSPSGSNASSRDTSPNRDANSLALQLKPPIIINKGPRGFGFTFRAIRVYHGDSDIYTMHHLVLTVENNSPAFEAGLRPGDLITHINGEPVQGLLHHEVNKILKKIIFMIILNF